MSRPLCGSAPRLSSIPGAAALTGVVGVVTYTALIRFWGQRLRLPWYKYPFNAGQVALLMGVTSMLFRSLEAGGDLITLAVVPAAAAMYLVNTSLVSGAVSLQLRVNALNTWWKGTKENGLTDQESPGHRIGAAGRSGGPS